MLLTKAELYKIKEKTVFDEDNMRWIVPYFYLRQKEVQLPKINARAVVKKEKKERDVVIYASEHSNHSGLEDTYQSDDVKSTLNIQSIQKSTSEAKF